MASTLATMGCVLYASAFSGEVVFSINDAEGDLLYEGVAPKHYAEPNTELSSDSPVSGTLRVRLIRNGGNTALVAFPDGESIEVPANIIK